MNGTTLEPHRIRGVKDKKISFPSIPRTAPQQRFLNVQISKKSVLKTLKQKHNPCDGLDEILLLDINIEYVDHSEYQ